MEIETLFNQLSNELSGKIHFLEDKPEETLESTLKALWLKASGTFVSAEKAIKTTLPELNREQINKLNELINQRINNVPLAHLTNRQNFMGIELIADKRALIPRKETEILGEKTLELSYEIALKKDDITIMDVCCGSGNLGIAVAKQNLNCKVFLSDISSESVELTRENVELLDLNDRVIAFESDMFEAFKSDIFYAGFDIILCNPPYISSTKVVKMNAEISLNEPALAFDGGMLGIKIIKQLIAEAPLFLKPEGWLAFEVGVGQGDFVLTLIEKSKHFQQIDSVLDAVGNIRVIFAQKVI